MLIIVSNKLVQIDADDLADIGLLNWYVSSQGYVVRSCGRGNAELLHRRLLRAPNGMVVDHINGDPLDNRRENIRICTQAENLRNKRLYRSNKSGFKGVTQRGDRWRACVNLNGRRISLGTYETPQLAHEAYCAAAKKYHGEFAKFS